jgi:hypothetical protein
MPAHNTDGIINKLSTIFADSTRTVLMTTKTTDNQQNLLAAGGQGSDKSGLITCIVIGKNCAVLVSHRDSISAKEPRHCTGASPSNAY